VFHRFGWTERWSCRVSRRPWMLILSRSGHSPFFLGLDLLRKKTREKVVFLDDIRHQILKLSPPLLSAKILRCDSKKQHLTHWLSVLLCPNLSGKWVAIFWQKQNSNPDYNPLRGNSRTKRDWKTIKKEAVSQLMLWGGFFVNYWLTNWSFRLVLCGAPGGLTR
jgi:hypothetical protein